ncbi:MAG: DsrE/DsrF/DrsH-like family protein [Candidatus Thermoplasmatota archaeon]|nr:DsrE/DsrF/DrsH-like family protein [Candidatus Thermoplasmatota archaeon]
MSLLLVSGTADKLMAGSIIASGGVANGMDIDIFVSFWGLMEMKKDAPPNMKLSFEGKDMADQIFAVMKEKKVPGWKEMLRQAKDVGNIKVYACAMFADLMGLKKEDLDPMVDSIIGVSEFVDMAKDSKVTLFI